MDDICMMWAHGKEKHYLRGGYPLKPFYKHALEVARFSQKDLLEVTDKTSIETSAMVTTYNPNNPNIRRFIHTNWNISEHSSETPV